MESGSAAAPFFPLMRQRVSEGFENLLRSVSFNVFQARTTRNVRVSSLSINCRTGPGHKITAVQ